MTTHRDMSLKLIINQIRNLFGWQIQYFKDLHSYVNVHRKEGLRIGFTSQLRVTRYTAAGGLNKTTH